MGLSEKEYFTALQGKRVLVLGLGVSNRPLVRLLLQYGISVVGCDKTPRQALDEEVLQLEKDGCQLKLGPDYLQDLSADVVFRTPGIHPQRPELQRLRQGGAKVTSEMEAFFEICPCRIIAVTGSDGKTTTTTLIAELLKKAGKTVWLGGNIGTPLLERAKKMRPDDWAVVELSSFQLLDMERSAQIAVVTNVTPNHLDVHRDMEEYIAAKEAVFRYQKPADKAVFNLDNPLACKMQEKAPGKAVGFSCTRVPEVGVYFQDGAIYRTGSREPVLQQKDILIPGIHNVENYMAAICAVEGLVSDADIQEVARTFTGVEHRIELVRVKDGVAYYNDSIASSPTRTIAGLRSFEKQVILIAGGYDKHIPYDVLGPEIVERVKTLVLTGATAPKIKAAVQAAPGYGPNRPEIVEQDDFYDAVAAAAKLAQSGDIVLLSPASASFDRFPNFMVRGNEFKKKVMEL